MGWLTHGARRPVIVSVQRHTGLISTSSLLRALSLTLLCAFLPLRKPVYSSSLATPSLVPAIQPCRRVILSNRQD